MSQPFSDNHSTLNATVTVSNNFTVVDDRSDILDWLSPLDPKLRHQEIRERRVESVGDWLLQTEEFRSWRAGSGGGASDNGVLFCYGDPGVGKTFISSLVIDRLCDQEGGQNATVACLYFDFAVQKEQSSMSMLRALLKQLVGGLEETPEEILRAYRAQKSAVSGREPGPSDIIKMLQVTASKKRTFICIDALDECVTAHRVKLLDSLKQVLQNTPGTWILVTGRPQVGPELGRRLSGRVMSVSITPRIGDIVSYLRTRLDEDTDPDAMDSSLEADILSKIPKEISEIFLLVSLNIDAILQETTISRRRQKLRTMTGGVGLGDAYGTTIGRIKGLGGERTRLGMAALMWISHSERPLKLDEIRHAVAVEIGSPNLDSDNVPSIGTLLSCCQGLAAVDKKASTVRLTHSTVHEYLRSHPELFGTAHATMAETCLSYLNSHQVKVLSASPSPNLQDTPFLEYSSLFWGVHAQRELSDCAKLLALKLFEDNNNYIPSKILLKAHKMYPYLVGSGEPLGFSGLHCASFFGLVDIIASLVEVEGCDINQVDCAGNTPLVLASRNGHEGVVNILLGRASDNPEKSDPGGQTPLIRASRNGHEGVANVPLGRANVNPEKADMDGQTPLIWATQSGHEAVVKILLRRGDVIPDRPDRDGRTPLLWAARSGHEGVVNILVRRSDVNPDKPDTNGRTPLIWAVRGGHEAVVGILLGQDDVNPDKQDNDGRTSLSWAAWSGNEGMVKVLLGRGDLNPNEPDGDHCTPLIRAAANGHEGVVKILLGRADIIPDKPDDIGQTPLHWAAWGAHEGVAKILLGRDDVSLNKPDYGGLTPLGWATFRRHEGLVTLLRGRDDVNLNKPDHG